MKYSDETMAKLLLASASPRRKQLLESAGLSLDIRIADIDETHRDGESAADYVARMAYSKAKKIVDSAPPNTCVLAADTIVVCDGAILGKPESEAHAFQMLRQLSDRTHDVMTAVAIALTPKTPSQKILWKPFTVTTKVEFRRLSDAQIRAYIETGEPMDKAGAYGIQGRAAAFVKRIDGSYTNVVGLPLCEVVEILETLPEK